MKELEKAVTLPQEGDIQSSMEDEVMDRDVYLNSMT